MILYFGNSEREPPPQVSHHGELMESSGALCLSDLVIRGWNEKIVGKFTVVVVD